MFADGDKVIHANSQYHARSKTKCGITMMSVDKFLHPRKKTWRNEFIPCSNDVCRMLNHCHKYALNWPHSEYKHIFFASLYRDMWLFPMVASQSKARICNMHEIDTSTAIVLRFGTTTHANAVNSTEYIDWNHILRASLDEATVVMLLHLYIQHLPVLCDYYDV